MPDPTWSDSTWFEDASTAASTPPLEAIRRLGDFELLRELGRGAMGIVYEARQLSLDRRVALKLLPPALGFSREAIQRFEREAQAAAKLHHTNIVPVHAIGEQDGHHFYVMELIEGESFEQVLQDAGLRGAFSTRDATFRGSRSSRPPDEQTARGGPEESPARASLLEATGRVWFDGVALLIAGVADGLHYAHACGVIHRDIKPANLMLARDGRSMIMDFGLARVGREANLTATGAVLGTPSYMSPEQITGRGDEVDHRSDIYSLGTVLYEMLTGAPPFSGCSFEGMVAAIVSVDPRPPRRTSPGIPADLETICLKAMEKDPARRYVTAGDLAADLRRYLMGDLIKARPAGPLRRAASAVRRHPVVTTIGISLFVLSAAVAGFGRWTTVLKTNEAVQRAVSEAKTHMNAGLYREGFEKIEQAVALDRDSVEARLVRAHLLIKLGRTREAVGEAEALLLKNPDDWTAHLVLALAAPELPWISAEDQISVVEARAPNSADAYYLRSLVAESSVKKLELLDRALELDPSHSDALLDRIDLFTNSFKDYEAALLDCERLRAVRPRSAQGRRMRAVVYLDQRDLNRALSEIESAIDFDPSDAANYQVRAATLRAMGRHTESIADYARAIELDPRHAPFYEQRSDAHNDAGRFELAVEDARRALDLDPDRRSAHLPLFRALLSLDRKDELRQALGRLRSVVDAWTDPRTRAWGYRQIADEHGRLKDYEQAGADIDRAIEIDPAEFRGFVSRAQLRLGVGDEAGFESDCHAAASVEARIEPTELEDYGEGLGWTCRRWQEVLSQCDRFVDRFPKWHVAYNERGRALIMLDRHEEALADLTRAIELAPSWMEPYLNRAVVFDRMNRAEDLLANVSKAIELDPLGSPHLWLGRSEVHFRLGRLDRAFEDADKAIELDPLSLYAFMTRARLLAFTGRCDRAMQDLRRAQSLGPRDPDLSRGLASTHLGGFRFGCPDQYDPIAALRHAREGFDASPEGTAEILGEALYRNGHYEEARRIFMDRFEKENGKGTWFMLSMCDQQLGNTTAARQHYDRSAAWMEEYWPNDPILAKLEEESAKLLGIDR